MEEGWCRWAKGSKLCFEAKHFFGVTKPPSSPQVRMWNFLLACACATPLRPNPGSAVRWGRALWAKREAVRLGAVSRPSSLVWAPQRAILSYEVTHVVYLMAPKRARGRSYVGITSMSGWLRLQGRIQEVFYADGTQKQLPPEAKGGFASHVQAIGADSFLCDYFMMILEHVPAVPNETAMAWKMRAHQYERWWIRYLDVGLLRRGWNVEHTRLHWARRRAAADPSPAG